MLNLCSPNNSNIQIVHFYRPRYSLSAELNRERKCKSVSIQFKFTVTHFSHTGSKYSIYRSSYSFPSSQLPDDVWTRSVMLFGWYGMTLLILWSAWYTSAQTDQHWLVPWIRLGWDALCPWPALPGTSYVACYTNGKRVRRELTPYHPGKRTLPALDRLQGPAAGCNPC